MVRLGSCGDGDGGEEEEKGAGVLIFLLGKICEWKYGGGGGEERLFMGVVMRRLRG